jgi:hypothetical protein
MTVYSSTRKVLSTSFHVTWTALCVVVLYRIPLKSANKLGKCGQLIFMPGVESRVLAFPAPIFTYTVNSNWRYVEISPEPANKYARICRDSFTPEREVWPSLGQLWRNATLARQFFFGLGGGGKEHLYRISWKSDVRFRCSYEVTDGRGLHIRHSFPYTVKSSERNRFVAGKF